jgi:glycosyltransferase involved in cell wall biosynthesis
MPPRDGRTGPVQLLAVGAIVRRKGYDVLVTALDALRTLDWRLTIVGDARDPDAARALKAQIAAAGLGERIMFAGAVAREQLPALYAAADLFVLPSRYEGFGMAYAEAIAHGLPVIGTTAGAITETVPADAGVLVAPDDAAALAVALRSLIANAATRARLAAGARSAAERLPTWRGSAERFAAAIARVA